jgi:hypothetical protein
VKGEEEKIYLSKWHSRKSGPLGGKKKRLKKLNR